MLNEVIKPSRLTKTLEIIKTYKDSVSEINISTVGEYFDIFPILKTLESFGTLSIESFEKFKALETFKIL